MSLFLKPCPHCNGPLKKYNEDSIYYSTYGCECKLTNDRFWVSYACYISEGIIIGQSIEVDDFYVSTTQPGIPFDPFHNEPGTKIYKITNIFNEMTYQHILSLPNPIPINMETIANVLKTYLTFL